MQNIYRYLFFFKEEIVIYPCIYVEHPLKANLISFIQSIHILDQLMQEESFHMRKNPLYLACF